MQIITDLEYRLSASAVTLGKFDGIHLGHRMLLDKILSRRDLLPVVFTFAQDSQTGVLPAQQIYSQQEKDFILRQMGIAAEILFPFRETTRNMSSEQILRDVLIRNIQARKTFVLERTGRAMSVSYRRGHSSMGMNWRSCQRGRHRML